MPIDLDYTELDYVRRQLDVTISNVERNVLPSVAENATKDAESRVEHYPAKLPNQRYIRTGTYERSAYADWKPIADGVQIEFGSTGAIQNGRRYDQYLKDERNQAAIHKGRWTTLQDDATKVMEGIDKDLQSEMTKEGWK